MFIFSSLMPDTVDIFDPNFLGLLFIIVAAGFFLLGLFLRALKLRGVSRILFVCGSLFLIAYSSLVFVNIGSTITNNDWAFKDFSDLTLFGVSILLFIHFLWMAIKKR